MTSNPAIWNELHQSELPAMDLLAALGYGRVDARDEAQRARLLRERGGSERTVVLLPRLERALRRLNPWLTDDGLRRAVRALTHIDAATLIEANEQAWVALTYGISVEVNDGGRRTSRQVRYFDFDNPHSNDFLAVQQLRVAGTRKGIAPDITVFVNGVPLAVVECKAPTLGEEWLHEATEQLERYQELGEKWRGQGAPQLFHSVQLAIAACGQGAYYGTVCAPGRWFLGWKDTYPLPEARLASLVRDKCKRELQPQDTLLAGMLAPANLLDLARNFVAFETENGRRVRKVARYQQYRAVNKALERIRTARDPARRGGVVWHTQGSGKSLTMLWLAAKLRRMRELDNPAIVVVTDRRDLDRQIEGAFVRAGYQNPARARSVRHLRELLAAGAGQTVMTTVQKFQDAVEPGGRRAEHPLLTAASNVFVMVDEAHRTQYRNLATNMRAALPNACFLGFTGTPIDRNDRSTRRTFGDYIDTYTIRQSVEDGATVPIYYESRLADLHVQGGETVDALFERMFADRTAEEHEAIKRRYATEVGIAGAPRRIELICLDIIKHYDEHIRPDGFKAQLVAATREIAVLYKETLDRLNGPPSALIMSSSNDDVARLATWRRSPDEQRRLIDSFKDDPPETLAVLVVCDMLLTGFDAPVEQVMYLDSPLREHTLLQAIARVNRPAEGKTYGLVVDYWGVSSHLQDALAIFDPDELGEPMLPLDRVAEDVEMYDRAAVRFFARVNRTDLEACVRVLEPEDARAQFEEQFAKFARAMDRLMPDPRAIPYREDLKWLGHVRLAAAARFRDKGLDISDCGEKVRALIAEYIGAERIERLLEPVSILSPKFDEAVEKLETSDAKASEMEHAIKHELKIRYEENPVFYQTLRERLEQILAERKLERISSAEELKRLRALADELRGVADIAGALGLTRMGFAIYELLLQDAEDGATKVAEARAAYHSTLEEPKRELAGLIEDELERLAVIDWRTKDDVQREMRRQVKRHLRATGVEGGRLDTLTTAVLDVARRGLPR